jgi:hypothetical protein
MRPLEGVAPTRSRAGGPACVSAPCCASYILVAVSINVPTNMRRRSSTTISVSIALLLLQFLACRIETIVPWRCAILANRTLFGAFGLDAWARVGM